MKYMILIGASHEAWDELGQEGRDRITAAHGSLIPELIESGEFVDTHQLGFTEETARTIRPSAGGHTVTDGPFIEAKDYVAGYYIVDAASIERATAIAERLVEAEFAPVEVRLIHQEPVEF